MAPPTSASRNQIQGPNSSPSPASNTPKIAKIAHSHLFTAPFQPGPNTKHPNFSQIKPEILGQTSDNTLHSDYTSHRLTWAALLARVVASRTRIIAARTDEVSIRRYLKGVDCRLTGRRSPHLDPASTSTGTWPNSRVRSTRPAACSVRRLKPPASLPWIDQRPPRPP